MTAVSTAPLTNVPLAIAPLAPADRPAWEKLARDYKTFYRADPPDAAYEEAWRRLMDGDAVHGLGASVAGRLVGITHYLFHASTWAPRVCYLQDLFVAPETRGQGVARALIDAVARDARAAGATRLYWLTQTGNSTARALYDRVARYEGFIRYDHAAF